jgi:Tol biopolymer transport system component
MNNTRFPSPARFLLAPALLLLSLSPAVAGDPPMTQIAVDGDAPSWSPDGERIAFQSDRAGNTDIWTMLATGEEQRRLTTTNIPDLNPDWSPDGTQIVFAIHFGVEWNLVLVPAEGGPLDDLTLCCAYRNNPAWSPDGTLIAYERAIGDTDVYVIPPSGNPETPVISNPNEEMMPAWSPDGTQIAFNSQVSGIESNISVAPAPGGPATQLTFFPGHEWNPDWSPDGSQIVFEHRLDFDHSAELWVVPAAGGQATQLTFPVWPASDREPAWSPDGTRIAFTSTRTPEGGHLGNHAIWVLTLPTAGVDPGAAPAIQDLSLTIDPHPVARQPSAVRFELAVAAPIRLALYGCDGRAVDVLTSGNRASGRHRIEWDARGVAPGVYFLRLETQGHAATRKVVVLDR